MGVIVKIRVKKPGFVLTPEVVAIRGDWRTNVCMIDLLRATPSIGLGFERIGKRSYAWSVQEWDGNR